MIDLHQTRREFFRSAGLAAVAGSVGECLAKPTPADADRPGRPNIILIFADDMGYGDAACYGNTRIKTPNIDALAATGQRWRSFYAAGCVCVPSRTGLMSGRYPARIHGERGIPAALPSREVTIAELLKTTGYATACLGKWHLGMNRGMHPNDQGFDYFYGTPSSNDHFARKGWSYNYKNFKEATNETFNVPIYRQKEIVERPAKQELFTKRYTEQAIGWIKEHREHPFFLYLAHNMPHVPIFASEEFAGRSLGKRYGDVIEEIDWSVGQIVKTLKENGLEKNTLVVFTSDNGPWLIYRELGGSAGPLNNGKGTCWEGGFRVPAIFRWPGRIKQSVVDDIGSGLDLWSTFARIAGAKPPNEFATDSLDLSGTLLQQKPSPRSTWFYFHESGRLWAVRSGKYKLHFTTVNKHRGKPQHHDPPLLFDLHEDQAETTNIAGDYPDVVAGLTLLVERFRKELETRRE